MVNADKGYEMNTSAKWKNIAGFVLLFFYCSNIYVPLEAPFLSDICTIVFFIYTILMIPDLGREFIKLKGHLKYLWLIPVGFVAVFLFRGLLWGNILQTITSHLGIDLSNDNDISVQERFEAAPVFMTIGCCLWGPVLEELLFRYTCFGIISRKHPTVAYLVSALLFGLFHVIVSGVWMCNTIQLLNMPGYIIDGLIFCFLFKKTRSLVIPVGLHMLINIIGVMTMLN